MLPRLIFRTLGSANNWGLARFCWNFGVTGMLSVNPTGLAHRPRL